MKKLSGIVIALAIAMLFFCSEYERPEWSDHDFGETIVVSKIIENTTPVVLMGDSRIFFGGKWENLPITTHNVGVGCTTIYGVVHRLHYIDDYNPLYVVIMCGVNEKRYNITIAEWIAEFNEVFNYIIAKNAHPIICDPTHQSSFNYPITNAIRDFLRQNYGAYYINFNLSDDDFIDLVHLNDSGYLKISTTLMDKISDIL